MVMDHMQLTIKQTANAIGIFRERAENIIPNDLGMTKVSVQWLKRLLTSDQKRNRLITSPENRSFFDSDSVGFLGCFINQDDCCVHHFEKKEHSTQGKHPPLIIQRRPKSFYLHRCWKCISYIVNISQYYGISYQYINYIMCR